MATVISFIIIFGLIVLAHELGHYLLGRKNGITVTEFFIGMGPTLFSFEKGGTKFSLKLFPIGGACLFEGETGNSIEKNEEGNETDNENQEAITEISEGSFLRASVGARFSTILAGPIFNFLLAYLIGLVIIGYIGIDLPVIDYVSPGGQAEAAGLMPGDVVTKINNEKIHIYRQIFFISFTSRGEPLDVTFERNGEKNQVTIIPRYNDELGRYVIGINAGGENTKTGSLSLFKNAYYEVKFGMVSTLKSLKMLVQGQLSADNIAGPVGMASMVGETYEMARPHGMGIVILNMLNIAMILSVNLGIMNLLPIPALDGGRLIFIILEMIRGKPIPPEKEGMVHLAGMIALMLLMVFVLYNDIAQIFAKRLS
ncbi:MAG: RIP metalloprotease RseP [Lachnospiraceae bacterium]|nr:RIP metalloprotease RseP [Lachnospiraceae bacterium]